MILDPLSGDQKDEKGNVVVPYEVFRQRVNNQAAARNKPPHPQPYPVLDKRWDEDAQQYVETIFAQGEPGDEI